MKRLSLLVLLVIAMTVALTACFGPTTPVDTHVHTYTDDWCVDATNHWHAADCEHKDETIVKTAHDFVDGKCSVCGYYSYYTVTVNAPAGVTVAGDLTTKNGADVTFTATVAEAYVLTATGAEQVGDVTVADGKVTYTYKVAAVKSADVVVEITAKQVKFVTEVTSGTAQFDSLVAETNSTVDVTFTVPAAGVYLVSTYNEFDYDIELNGENVAYVYAAEAGEITLTASLFSWVDSEEPVEFTYTVSTYSSEKFTLPALEGDGYVLPANLPITVEFVVPTPGAHFFSTTSPVTVNDTLTDNYYFQTTRPYETVVLTVYCEDTAEIGFDLNWNIYKASFATVELGNVNVTVPVGQYVGYSFTAPTTAKYVFATAGDASLRYYDESYEAMLFLDEYYLEAGDTLNFFVMVSLAEEEVSDVLTVKYAPREVDFYSNVADASAEGAENIIKSYGDSFTYIITAPEGTTMSFDGGETWVTEYELSVEGEDVVFLVKNATETEVELAIEEPVTEYYLWLGEPTEVTLEPGVGYTIYINDWTMDYFKQVVFDFGDANLYAMAGMNPFPISEGVAFDFPNPRMGSVTLYANGQETVTATIKLSYAEAASTELVLGNNSIDVPVTGGYPGEVETTFTATEAGTYTIAAGEGEENAVVIVVGANGIAEMVDLPYTIELAAGESITVVVSTDNYMVEMDTVDLLITKAE